MAGKGEIFVPTAWQIGGPPLSLGSVAAPEANGDITGDHGYATAPDVYEGSYTWALGGPALSLGSVTTPTGKGDIDLNSLENDSEAGVGAPSTWAVGGPTMTVTSTPAILGKGDAPSPLTWAIGTSPIIVPPPYDLVAASISPEPDVGLTWQEDVPSQPSINHYNVYRSTDGVTYTDIGSSTMLSFTDSSTAENTEYWYKVTAVLPNGTETLPSNIATILTPSQFITHVFTASGTYTPGVGLVSAVVTVIGGGGGGRSGGIVSAVTANGGDAGGAGGLSRSTIVAATLVAASPITVTIGMGGLGGLGIHTAANQLTGQNDGADGLPSSFGVLLSANGGKGAHNAGGTGGSGSTQAGGGNQNGGFGAGARVGNSTSVAAESGNSVTVAAGSGGGGGMAAFDFEPMAAAAIGGTGQSSAATPSLGGAVSANGANADMISGYAGGGGGGGAPGGAQGTDAGAGGLYGAGGGGGGGGYSATLAQYEGAGGNGAQGVVVVVEQYW